MVRKNGPKKSIPTLENAGKWDWIRLVGRGPINGGSGLLLRNLHVKQSRIIRRMDARGRRTWHCYVIRDKSCSVNSVDACSSRSCTSCINMVESWLVGSRMIGCLANSGMDACWSLPPTCMIPYVSEVRLRDASLDVARTGLPFRM